MTGVTPRTGDKMKIHWLFSLLAAASLCGCAAFTSGDVKVDRRKAEAMFADKGPSPFGSLSLDWQNLPYRSPSDTIGAESVIDEKGNVRGPEQRPVPVDPEDSEKLLRKASKIFTEAGLLSPGGAGPELRLKLMSMNRWTYGELFGSFLVDTGFIFILPSTLRANYLLAAEFETSTGTARVEVHGRNKTTFHALLAPLYPFFTPGGREKGLLNQMLWKAATEIHGLARRTPPAAGPAPEVPAPAAAEPAQAQPAAARPAARNEGRPPAAGAETPDD